jgi:hypothetical protein
LIADLIAQMSQGTRQPVKAPAPIRSIYRAL